MGLNVPISALLAPYGVTIGIDPQSFTAVGGSASVGADMGLTGGTGTNTRGGNVAIVSGGGGGGNARGGDITLNAQAGSGSGRKGQVIITGIPTSSPGVTGAIYKDGSGFVKIV